MALLRSFESKVKKKQKNKTKADIQNFDEKIKIEKENIYI